MMTNRPLTSLGKKLLLLCSSVAVFLIILEIGLRLGGFIFFSLQEKKNRENLKKEGTYRILCLGESMTALGGEDSYPAQLEKTLNAQQKQCGFSFKVINKGIPGTNTTGILAQLDYNLKVYKPVMVVVMMGINEEEGNGHFTATKQNPLVRFCRTLRVVKLFERIAVGIKSNLQQKTILARSAQTLKDTKPFQSESPNRPSVDDRNFSDDEKKALVLAFYYRDLGRPSDAENMFKEALKINPLNTGTLYLLAEFYFINRRYQGSIAILNEVIRLGEHGPAVYRMLAKSYQSIEKYDEIEKVLFDCIKHNLNNDRSYSMLAGWYTEIHRYALAEEVYKKSIEVNPGNALVYTELQLCYLLQGKYDEAIAMLKKAIENNPEKDRLYNALAYTYAKKGDTQQAKHYFDIADKMRSETFNPTVQDNYRKLAKSVLQAKIKLVCVQYPMRKIEPLRKMLEGFEGILFVENETPFRQALKTGEFNDYFADSFGGDFGHCRLKGNQLLANTIAQAILKEACTQR